MLCDVKKVCQIVKIALICCSKKKQNYRCEARELYAPSKLFSLSYQYAKCCADVDKIYILSSKYGLLFETDVVAPYELDLKDLPLHRQQDWANYVLKQLKEKCDIENDEFIIFAGRNYYQNLIPHLCHFKLPLGNRDIYSRIQFLQKQLENKAKLE